MVGKVNMNKENKIRLLKLRFRKLNPGVGEDLIDWDAEVGRRETFLESLEDLKGAYPMYRWDKRELPKSNEDAALKGEKKDLEEAGYMVLKNREYRHLVRAHQRLITSHSGRKGYVVNVKQHWRRNPRN